MSEYCGSNPQRLFISTDVNANMFPVMGAICDLQFQSLCSYQWIDNSVPVDGSTVSNVVEKELLIAALNQQLQLDFGLLLNKSAAFPLHDVLLGVYREGDVDVGCEKQVGYVVGITAMSGDFVPGTSNKVRVDLYHATDCLDSALFATLIREALRVYYATLHNASQHSTPVSFTCFFPHHLVLGNKENKGVSSGRDDENTSGVDGVPNMKCVLKGKALLMAGFVDQSSIGDSDRCST